MKSELKKIMFYLSKKKKPNGAVADAADCATLCQ